MAGTGVIVKILTVGKAGALTNEKDPSPPTATTSMTKLVCKNCPAVPSGKSVTKKQIKNLGFLFL